MIKNKEKLNEFKKEINIIVTEWNKKKENFSNIIIECSKEEHLHYKEYNGEIYKVPHYEWIKTQLNKIKKHINEFDKECNKLNNELNNNNVKNIYNITKNYNIEYEYDIPHHENLPCIKLWNSCSGLSSNSHLIYLSKEYKKEWKEIFKIIRKYDDINRAIAQLYN